MKRRLLTLAASAAVMLGIFVVAAPTPALAAKSQCASGRFCLWVDSGYSGGFFSWASSAGCFNLNNNPGIINKATSVFNNTSSLYTTYTNLSCSGGAQVYPTTGRDDSDLSWPPFTGQNDNIESFRRA